jgi:hypothetical protein
MNLSAEQRRRAETLVDQMQDILGSNAWSDGRAKTFDELEGECLEVGDWLTSRALERRAAAPSATDEPACCPDCQQPGERLPDDEVRIVQASRGETAWTEAGWFCRRCRRSFFPSLG